MKLAILTLLFFTTNLLVGCGESGNTNVGKNADAEAIAAYEEAVRKAETDMSENMENETLADMTKEVQNQ